MEERLDPVRHNLRRIFTGAKGTVGEYIALEALEGAVLGLFDLFTPEQLYEAIVGDVSIWDGSWGDFEQFRFQFQLLSRDERFLQHQHLFTAENVLIWLTDDDVRPELASLIVNTPGGIKWLESQVESLKTGLQEPIVEEAKIGE